ncbi:sulfotransferase family protein [Dankookia sp. P2]|uniref:sulfotransferase family protein n=1 Tax=Dankookia sp. P2 TaxID=3423955 RepID=UPI003D676B69
MHKLLAADPENRFPSVWETTSPLPRKRGDTPARRIGKMDRQLAAFERMAPGFRAVHPIDAVSPQECSEITAHVFRSYRFETTHHIPAYRTWLRAADHAPAYRFHRRFLQHLQRIDGRPRRWVLKCPDHVFTLDALAAEYPDARLVFLHRDPVEVLASVAGLTAILRRPFTANLDKRAIGRQVAGDWLQGTQAMLRADAEGLFPEERVMHLRFRDLTEAPVATIAAMYKRFGLPLASETRRRLEQRAARLPRGGYGGVTHALADYGIDADSMRRRFAAYAARFGV